MVKGLPGSGKSMLLKHLALTDGKQGGFNNSSARPIPVLVELHELTNPTLDLEKLEQHYSSLTTTNELLRSRWCWRIGERINAVRYTRNSRIHPWSWGNLCWLRAFGKGSQCHPIAADFSQSI